MNTWVQGDRQVSESSSSVEGSIHRDHLQSVTISQFSRDGGEEGIGYPPVAPRIHKCYDLQKQQRPIAITKTIDVKVVVPSANE